MSLEGIANLAYILVGPNAPDGPLTIVQIMGRTFVVYVAGLAIIRLGNSRLLARYGPFDIIIGYVLGSVLARGITGRAALTDTLVASAVLVLLHWLIASSTFYSDLLGGIFKGNADLLVRDGEVLKQNLRRNRISRKDLLEELHLKANLDDVHEVKRAYLERNGEIGVIPRSRESVVCDIAVAAGVQTVRIEFVPAK